MPDEALRVVLRSLDTNAADVLEEAYGDSGVVVRNVVSDFGADPTGVGDSTSAVQAAVYAALDVGGGVIYFPKGTYRLQPQSKAASADYHGAPCTYAVKVATREGGIAHNLTFKGDGWIHSELKSYVFGGGSPQGTVEGVNWHRIDLDSPPQAYCVRGNMFYIPANGSDTPSNIRFEGLRFHGQKPRESATWPLNGSNGNTPPFPASTVDGTGWDFLHHPIRIRDGYNLDGFVVSQCKLDEWGGEIILYSGAASGTFLVEDSLLWSSNASIISASVALTVRGCWIKEGSNAIECSPVNSYSWIYNNLIENCGFGIAITQNTGTGTGFIEIKNNVIRGNLGREAGMYLSGGIANCQVMGNTLYDTNITVSDQFGFTPYNIRVYNNSVYAHTRNMNVGITVTAGEHNAHNIVVEDNLVGRTSDAVASGFKVNYPALYISQAAFAGLVFRRNDFSDQGATTSPFIGVGAQTDPGKLPLIYDNKYIANPIPATNLVHFIGPALTNALAPRSDRLSLYGGTVVVGTTQQIASFRTTGYVHGQRILIRQYDTLGRGCRIDTTTTGVLLKHGIRHLTDDMELVLEFNSRLAKWVEISYGFAKEFYTTASAVVDASALWYALLPETATTLAPNLDARGCEQVTLAPTISKSYTDHVAFPHGVPVRVICNANTTITHNSSKIVLAGAANFAPGGSGGEIWLLKPTAASTKVNELYRITY